MSDTLSTAYRRRLDDGTIQADAGQARALGALVGLEAELNARGEPSFLSRFRKTSGGAPGVYLWGPVGRGKSMLMDLFFATAPIARKRREHFYAFMAEVHGLIKAWRGGDAAARKAKFGQAKGDDPIAPVAELIASQAQLLCFDELQVADIADAMILGRLFEALFAHGVILVATSNRPPDDLYQGGINRQLFLPFIDMLKARMEVVEVAGPRDHRLERLRGQKVYFAPVDAASRAAFEAVWKDQLNGDRETGADVEVLGRRLRFDRAAGGLVRASFAQLCGEALGSQDYLAVAGRFHTIFLEDLPVLSQDRRNEARRLVWLIDALYEAKARLVVLAEAEPDDLYPKGDGAFEFERTASRLQEMRSASWMEAGSADG